MAEALRGCASAGGREKASRTAMVKVAWGVWELICRDRRGFDASRAQHCVAKGERNTVRVLASAGNKMGLRTKLPKSAAKLIFSPKMAMVGAPQLPYKPGCPEGEIFGRDPGYVFF